LLGFDGLDLVVGLIGDSLAVSFGCRRVLMI